MSILFPGRRFFAIFKGRLGIIGQPEIGVTFGKGGENHIGFRSVYPANEVTNSGIAPGWIWAYLDFIESRADAQIRFSG